jgi:agmatinase
MVSSLMQHEWVSPYFLGSSDPKEADIGLFGLCWDGTSSFKPGSRFAGSAVRESSQGMEEFSFYQQASLMDIKYTDYGDLFLPPGQKDRVLASIESAVREVVAAGHFPIGYGGEHLLAYPLIMLAYERHPDLAVVHFDAHADIRPELWGDELTHATILGRVADKIGYANLKQFGIRSGSVEEWKLTQQHDTLRPFTKEAIKEHLDSLGDRPIYLTCDLDVLDPSIYPGTGTPEPGGILWDVLIGGLKQLSGRRLVGMDCLELSPHYDPSGVSAITMAKTLREMIILASRRKR